MCTKLALFPNQSEFRKKSIVFFLNFVHNATINLIKFVDNKFFAEVLRHYPQN
ncbi:hypothetical protein CSEC_1248 [Criblamydia sequanensis CRIB-18]|uniref:Uncharacterized protein n=1 Tax=Candidatus Criblamydia sequanensis CRIB-18 TaxID=1437425 RepID=A0A090D252_9BACT|nr:hypothetical protein CSEC_1248 [Criblamydia sequanensis CRIB-18]